jgi:hypothetical protein
MSYLTIDVSCERPLEVRILTERSAFDGQLPLHRVTLTPAEPIRAANPAVFEAMLGGSIVGLSARFFEPQPVLPIAAPIRDTINRLVH